MQDIERKDKTYVWHPFTQMQDWVENKQLVIAAGDGIKLIDIDGKAYYDGVSSLWLNVHGHRKAAIDQAIIDQLGKIAHTTMLGLANIPAAELAEQLVKIAPPGLTRVFYSDSGSTAVEIAVKMAYQYWQLKGQTQKKKFITLTNAYHGDTVGSVSVGGIDLFHRIFAPLLFETVHAPSPSCFHCTLGDSPAACGFACVVAVEKLLADHHGEIAAMVVEPLVQGAAGMLVQPPGYLRRVRELTQRYGVLLIVDEVATGFGRTGRMFACEHEGVSPDLMTMAKGITGGYLPLAATLTTDEIYNAFLGPVEAQKTFFHGHSYTGNPLACAAALANLRIFRDEQVIENLGPKIEAARRKLAAFWQLAAVADIRQCGLMIGIELMQDKATKQPYPPAWRMGHRVCMKTREYGLIIRPLGDVVVFMPPLASTVEEIEEMLDIIYRAIAEVTNC
ncbi:adenosylmethionine-8-amino-7-oxononanoate aminotransferase [Thermosinus carboxydivorans Nor1]|uniref:Adenosylmethionine-8-amino-7-oxononanoate aminotransferase n=1 Tax=Thermosinus carboxydivorans Nor1 TaxID=401526 RepID=A1HTZ2_9FIRM|nr:adenosylmethionine--8-amino-7-oxononanoate transaminase [Thermosinus carboxydivorans]EAX46513.1 adenosylmethionine-8-amino-7-oxononanoate aminotransferase [Thermosinus carboxydivorans Nor1]